MATLLWTSTVLLLLSIWARYRDQQGIKLRTEPAEPVFIEETKPTPASCDEIADLAGNLGWICEKNPSTSLWYRLSGRTDQGISWSLIQGTPMHSDERRDHGLRWSTNDVRLPYIWLEIYPRQVYNRMKMKAPESQKGAKVYRSLDSMKFIHETPPTMFDNPALNEKFVLVTLIPSMMFRLFTPDVEKALLSIGTESVRVSLGYPNLRASVNWANASTAVVKQLTEFGGKFAENFRQLNDSYGFETPFR